MEQEPGPRGSPQVPQAPPGLTPWADFSPPTAKLESCWLNRLLSHLGQAAFLFPMTIASKWWSHCWQMYSKIGIFGGSAKMIVNTYYKTWETDLLKHG
jgi:hypothetical protein